MCEKPDLAVALQEVHPAAVDLFRLGFNHVPDHVLDEVVEPSLSFQPFLHGKLLGRLVGKLPLAIFDIMQRVPSSRTSASAKGLRMSVPDL